MAVVNSQNSKNSPSKKGHAASSLQPKLAVGSGAKGHRNGDAIRRETRTEQAILASEVSYRRLFEAARDGILILDVDTGRIIDVNPFLVELLGFSHEEMVGKTVGELSPFKDILSNQAMLERLQEKATSAMKICRWKPGRVARLPSSLSATCMPRATKK